MTTSARRRGAVTSLLLSLSIALAATLPELADTTPFFFEVTLATSVPGTVQLFYDPTGADRFREEDSARFQTSDVTGPVTHRFPLPEGRYTAFRFDPIDRQGQVTLSSARIVRARPWGIHDEVVRTIPASRFRALLQVAALEASDAEAHLVTADNANDPIVMVPLDEPLVLKRDITQAYVESGGALALLAGAIRLLFWLLQTIQERSQAALRAGWRRAVSWSGEHPVGTIALMAVFAALLSSHPVVFFGRSFVSPDHGTLLLYDRYPTLPGYRTTDLEDVKGADVGAPMWQQLPYSAIEARAILKDAELPLWNRYNSTGVTLLGQGQSMIGDPLNLGVILAGATSWAWDVKYVVAKALFGLAVGLTVFACTGHLATALILTFSSLYIGFFAYRFSHPALFSLAYSPWILYCWVRFVRAPADQRSNQVRWLCGLVAANWAVINSGTAKEAYMLLASLNLTGGLLLLFAREPGPDKWRRALRVLFAEVLFALISTPVVVTFLDALRKSYSAYGTPAAIQVPPALFIGLFDDLFYRQLIAGEAMYAPSANFLILAGLLWAVVRFRDLASDSMFLAIGAGTLVPLSLVFGVVPAGVISATPFLGNIIHIHNTFSVVAVVHLAILAGFGVHACSARFANDEWRLDMAMTVVLLTILVGLYFGAARAAPKSDFFELYTVSLVAGFVALPVLARQIARTPARPEAVVLLLLSFSALHWRHGMYLHTGADDYVMNPQTRVQLRPESAAVRFITAEAAPPARTVGFEGNMFAGYNGALGVESIYGADALVNPFYREFAKQLPLEWGWDWRLVVQKKNLAQMKPVYDLLNVRSYLSLPDGPPPALPGLTLAGRFDLDVYRSETAWPRAFFSNQVVLYRTAAEFAGMALHGDGRPFVAVQEDSAGQHGALRALAGPRQSRIVAATDYRLTNNTTTFIIVAPEPGIVALTEAYVEGDFSATLNGRPATVLRVNHAFKGVAIDAPGTYTVTFEYWPERLSLSLLLGGIGLLLLALWLYLCGIRRRCERPAGPADEPHAPLPSTTTK